MSEKTLVEQLRESQEAEICDRKIHQIVYGKDCPDGDCSPRCRLGADLADLIEAKYTPNSKIESKHMPYPIDADGVPCIWGDNVFREDVCEEKHGQVKGWQKDSLGRWYVIVSGVSHERVWIACECHHVEPPKQLTKEDIDVMAKLYRSSYWNCFTCSSCSECPSKIEGKTPYAYYGVNDCTHAQILDILRKERERVVGER